MHNKHIKNRPQKMWAGLAIARLLCGRYGLKAPSWSNFRKVVDFPV